MSDPLGASATHAPCAGPPPAMRAQTLTLVGAGRRKTLRHNDEEMVPSPSLHPPNTTSRAWGWAEHETGVRD